MEPMAMQLKADVVILFEIESSRTRTIRASKSIPSNQRKCFWSNSSNAIQMVSQENVCTAGFPNRLAAHHHLNRQVLAVLDGLFNHIFKGHPLTVVGVRMTLKLISGVG